MTRDDIKETAEKTAKDVKEAGEEALAAVKGSVAEAASEAKKAVTDEAEARVDAGKDMVADQGQRLASDLRDAAESRGEDSFQGRLLDTVASGVSDISENLRGRSLSSILEQAEGFARRNPGAFIAGAAIAGFALARFARASADPGDDTHMPTAGTAPATPSPTRPAPADAGVPS